MVAHRIGAPIDGISFNLTDCSNHACITDRNFLRNGSWNLLYFGFTHCAEVCPNTLLYIDRVLEEFSKKSKQVSVPELRCAFVSLDPVRDTPKKMEAFIDRFTSKNLRKRYSGYTGTSNDIQNICKLWKVYFSSPDEDHVAKNPEYQIDHSCFIFLVSPEGKFCDFFTKDMPTEMVVDKIEMHAQGLYD